MPEDKKIAKILIEENNWIGHNCTKNFFEHQAVKDPT